MENDENIEKALKYLFGKMSNEEKQDFEKSHLENEDAFNDIMLLCQIENSLQPSQTDDEAWKKVNEKLKPKARFKILKSIVWAVAAAVAVMFVFVKMPSNNPKMLKYTASSVCEVVNLPDGSVVCLNNGATIEYPQNFNKNRIVKFNGEGFFDVKHDEKSKFVIETSQAKVTVLGTEFNLNTSLDKNVIVSVTDGCVRIDNNNSSVTVGKNEQATAQNGKKFQKTKISDAPLQWQAQLLEFKDCKLEKVAEKLCYVYGQEIVFDSKEIANLKLTSRYQNSNFEDIMLGISAAFNIKVEKSPVSGVWVIGGK